MSVWSARSLGRSREYILLKHTLPNVNYSIMGIKFRGGYAVVEKDSKTHFQLKKIPILKNAKEYPIETLRDLPFITRLADVKTVYGTDVYNYFLNKVQVLDTQIAAEEKVKAEIAHVEQECKCSWRVDEELCNNEAIKESPSGYCHAHFLKDDRLKELGIIVPLAIPKKEKYAFRMKVIEQLRALKKQGAF